MESNSEGPVREHEVIPGGFGFIINPALPNIINGIETNFPGYITKGFFKPNTYERTISKLNLLPGIMNSAEPNAHNIGHSYKKYSKVFTLKNLPKNVRNKIKNNLENNRNNTTIKLLRMPYMGVDISLMNEMHVGRLRNIPFQIIVEQFVKLFRQTAVLIHNKYIHRDIRETNILIDPESARMTIIDFDLLSTHSEYYRQFIEAPFHVRYLFPPELFIMYDWNRLKDIRKPVTQTTSELFTFIYYDKTNPNVRLAIFDKYLKNQLGAFRNVFQEWGFIKDTLTNTVQHLGNYIISVNRTNIEYLHTLLSELIERGNTVEQAREYIMTNIIIPTMDNFGLAFSILQLIGKLYPSAITFGKELIDISMALHNNNEEPKKYSRMYIEKRNTLKDNLRGLITHGDRPYSEDELTYISGGLLKLVIHLHGICSYDLQKRLHIYPFKTINSLYLHLKRNFNMHGGGDRRRVTRKVRMRKIR